MVREKDEAAKRAAKRDAMRKKMSEDLERNTIMFRWFVIEHTPAYNTGGYYDQDVRETNVVVSPPFDREEDATLWMSQHEPDRGKELRIRRDRLVRRVYEEWVSY